MNHGDVKPPKGWTSRPNFTPSQLLTADQLNRLMDEQRGRLEALTRGLHGHGVIHGFAAKLGENGLSLEIGAGMALDRHGRLLCWPGGPFAHCDEVKIPQIAGDYVLCVHYARREQPGRGCG